MRLTCTQTHLQLLHEARCIAAADSVCCRHPDRRWATLLWPGAIHLLEGLLVQLKGVVGPQHLLRGLLPALCRRGAQGVITSILGGC